MTLLLWPVEQLWCGGDVDPFRSLWLYLVEREIDPKKTDVALQQRYDKANRGQWGWNIVEFYLGNISEKTLMERLKADE